MHTCTHSYMNGEKVENQHYIASDYILKEVGVLGT